MIVEVLHCASTGGQRRIGTGVIVVDPQQHLAGVETGADQVLRVVGCEPVVKFPHRTGETPAIHRADGNSVDDGAIGAEVSDGNMTPLERKAQRIVVAADRDSDLFECDALTTLAFPSLTALRSYELHECDAMTDLGAFPLVTALDGELAGEWNDALASVNGLPALASVGVLTLHEDPQLVSLAGLTSLTAATTLDLRDLDGLGAIDLPLLATVGTLEVTSNLGLADVGLPALTAVTVGAVVGGNPNLSQCALETLFDRVTPPVVNCAENLDDGCSAWCVADTGP